MNNLLISLFAEKEAQETAIFKTLDKLPVYPASKRTHKIHFIVSLEDSSYFCPAENAVYDWAKVLHKRWPLQTTLNASYFLTTTEDIHFAGFESYLKTICTSNFNQTVIIICDAKNAHAVKMALSSLPNFASSNKITGEKFEIITQKIPAGLAQIRSFSLLTYLNVNQRKYA